VEWLRLRYKEGEQENNYWVSFLLSKMADSRKRRVTIKSLCLLLLLILIFPLPSLIETGLVDNTSMGLAA